MRTGGGSLVVTGHEYITSDSVVNGAVVLAAVPGMRFLLHYVGISIAAGILNTCTEYGIQFIQGGNPIHIHIARTTLTLSTVNSESNPDVLTDVNTAITIILTGTLTAGNVRIGYMRTQA